jgi:hypothetical protein
MHYCQGAAEDKGCEEPHETATQLHWSFSECFTFKSIKQQILSACTDYFCLLNHGFQSA